jgi:hypothetical protein
MKTLSNLSAVAADSAAAVQKSSGDLNISQSQKGKWRHIRASAMGFYLESSDGGLVHIPHSEIWALGEQHDARLCMPPKPIINPTLQNKKT